MIIGLCQVDSQWEDKELTKTRIFKLINSWKGRADCLVFPEMVLSGFSMNIEKTTLTKEDHDFFMEIAKKTGSEVVYGGVMEGYNSMFKVNGYSSNPDVIYKKKHLFSFSGENNVYKSGEESKIVTISGVKISFGICYDLRFSYHFWENASEVDAFLLIAAWPSTRREHWKALLPSRAIENQAYFIGVNRVGTDPKLSYSGDSAIYGPFGTKILECNDDEGIFTAEVSANETKKIRETYQFLKDRVQ